MKLNGLYWNIKHDTLPTDEAESTLGLTCPAELTIKIQHGLNDELERRTFIHELAHAICFSYGIHLENEEEACEFVSDYFDLIKKIMKKFDKGGL